MLVIEVSETTLRYDRQTKVSLYARHGISEVWIFDTQAKQLHVFRNPVGTTYSEVSTIDQPPSMQIGALPGIAIETSSLFD
jgi:Uma2 family endonuclease